MAKESDLVRKSRLPGWIIRSLQASGLNRLSTIAALSDKQLLKVPGIGPRALTLIRAESERINQQSAATACVVNPIEVSTSTELPK